MVLRVVDGKRHAFRACAGIVQQIRSVFLALLSGGWLIQPPGASPTWSPIVKAGPIALKDRYATRDGAQPRAAFLCASCLFGNMVVLLSSWLDELYDSARRHMAEKRATCPRTPVGARLQPSAETAIAPVIPAISRTRL